MRPVYGIAFLLLIVAAVQLTFAKRVPRNAAQGKGQPILKNLLFLTKSSRALAIERSVGDVLLRCHYTNTSRLAESGFPGARIYISEAMMTQFEEECADFSRHQQSGINVRDKRFTLLYPNTNWCGAGNDAEHAEDLGSAVATDTCCRTHDHCLPAIGPLQERYGLWNNALWTKLSCDCERQFYDCLKAVTTEDEADAVGNIYFNFLNSDCMRLQYPLVCVESGWWGSCNRWAEDTTQSMVWKWVEKNMPY